ncbi:alpha-amylase family glycosyl hydrolase [Sphaerochaeta pleomorpha]|uniref:alpha-amylase family glycosyl hydrolase n=1 Tax=Sphaerochaeta pleomorpha TaxID=1131707 RepID=UPI00155B3907|nr:alpha-amylase family glycosyl hydrolase [Sphaerochaeta pleomorpha]
MRKWVGDAVSTIHLLPFYPSSSDDGFSVIDPFSVDTGLGTWDHINDLQAFYALMFDFVANHLSRSNIWIRECFAGNPEYKDFAIFLEGTEDLTQVFRPRNLPLITQVDTDRGKRYVWTTFSKDQVDVNYHNPEVLYCMMDVLLAYVLQRGASIIRLDAVAYLWKEIGTNCIHHEKTHAIVRLFCWLTKNLTKQSFIITETNVPHNENVAYFGDGSDEATLVYNFSLPPLVFHTFLSQDASVLGAWAKTLVLPSSSVAFFNFLASHDGIGLMPVKNLLSDGDVEKMCLHTVKQGGFVSRRSKGDGTESPYELNINYLSALSGFTENEPRSLLVSRFKAATAIMVFLKGIPGIYINSLIGSQNWYGDPELTLYPRRINREKVSFKTLSKELDDPNSLRSAVLGFHVELLRVRKREPAFSPSSEQRILALTNSACFVFLRGSSDDSDKILVLINVTPHLQRISIEEVWSKLDCPFPFDACIDLLEKPITITAKELVLNPYQVQLLKTKPF